jgi:hypothetical protein
LWDITAISGLEKREYGRGDHQCGFQRNRSTTDKIFFIRQILEEKKQEYNESIHQLFIDFKKAYDSVRISVLYNILIESGRKKLRGDLTSGNAGYQ